MEENPAFYNHLRRMGLGPVMALHPDPNLLRRLLKLRCLGKTVWATSSAIYVDHQRYTLEEAKNL